MNRRELFRAATAAAVTHPFIARRSRAGGAATDEFDRFGGWTGRKFEATGFFRAEKDERWWLVTPEGNAFLSFGVNHLHPDLFYQEYNKDAWKALLDVGELPGPRFRTALKAWFLRTCREYGFNSVGVHNSLAVVNAPRPSMPYLQPIRFVDIPHWKTDIPADNFLDVYAGEFPRRCDPLASENPELAAIFTGGILWRDHAAQAKHGQRFAEASTDQQTDLLDLLVAAERGETGADTTWETQEYRRFSVFGVRFPTDARRGIRFFGWARRLIVDAYYTSPVGLKDLGFLGNASHTEYKVPQEAVDYALRRSPFTEA